MRHKMRLFQPDNHEGWFWTILFSMFASMVLSDHYGLWVLGTWALASTTAAVLCLRHHASGLGYIAGRIWNNYRRLSPELQAQIPLTTEWLRTEFRLLDTSEQENVGNAVRRLFHTHIERQEQEARKLVSYKPILDGVADATAAEKAEVETLRQLHDEAKAFLNS